MDELSHQTGHTVGTNPEAGNSLDEAQTLWTIRIYEETNQAYRNSVDKEVKETLQIDEEQTLLYLAPFVEESARRLGQKLLDQQDRSIEHIEAVVAAYRRRSYR